MQHASDDMQNMHINAFKIILLNLSGSSLDWILALQLCSVEYGQ